MSDKPIQPSDSSQTSPSPHAIDFRSQSPAAQSLQGLSPQTSPAKTSVWQKVIAFLVVIIIAVSAIVVALLSQRLIDAQTKFAKEQTEIVHQLITKIDDLQALNAKQLKTLKETQAKELKIFKELQTQKLQELQDTQTSLLEGFKQNRDEQLQKLREQMAKLPGAPKKRNDDD